MAQRQIFVPQTAPVHHLLSEIYISYLRTRYRYETGTHGAIKLFFHHFESTCIESVKKFMPPRKIKLE